MVETKSKGVKEMRELYGIGKSAWSNWLSRLKKDRKIEKEMKDLGFVSHMRIYTPAQVRFLFNKLGNP